MRNDVCIMIVLAVVLLGVYLMFNDQKNEADRITGV